MASRLKRFMSTALAVTLIFLAIVLWTGFALGPGPAWRMAVVLGALGLADAILGALRKHGTDTLSESVNRAWHRDPRRYIMWLIGLGLALALLHFHFTSV